MNDRQWTQDAFEETEKIRCTIFMTIDQELGDNRFAATMSIISKRPIYSTTYESTVLNIVDRDVAFTYKQFDPIEYSEAQFIDNLSSILAFYAFYIIGMDYETYALQGGTEVLQQAELLVQNIPAVNPPKGWKPFEKNQRNRYFLITDYLNPRNEAFRTGMYEYYRQGLDLLYLYPDSGMQNVLGALDEFAKVARDNPNNSIVRFLAETKDDEFIKMFAEADEEVKKTAIGSIKAIDAINADKYQRELGVR